jgi:hypothetical protein
MRNPFLIDQEKLSAGKRLSKIPLSFLISFLLLVCLFTRASWAAAPKAPTNLIATAASSRQINLSWKDNATNETNYYVERAPTSSGTWTVIATLGANTTSYQNSGLTQSTAYYYRVRCKAGSTYSSYSNTANATTAALAAPTSLTATVASASQINLSWTDNTTYETNYYVERATASGGPYTQVGSLGANVTGYSDTGLTAGTTYYYRVRAYDGTNYSVYSNTANATIITITASAGTGGNISPTGVVMVSQGANQTFTITPNTGYQISNVLVDGSSVGVVNSYTFNNVTANHTIAANFADVTAPTGSIVINSGSALTNFMTVTLTLNATDSGSGVAQMQFSNDGQTWSAPEQYYPTDPRDRRHRLLLRHTQ